ncbi:DNA polymerase III subunit gamma/tau [Agromyces bracchium]|uniref:DNA polymerase III subunit gamma/tau n=1 Tax=Agromyces bracchium TaxID=88376 RepID=A0A6I3M1I6_9MICO|nr:DNA polymerase III subunit gamma/tau [Agromyces bracchium]MTH66778.1 DNA polymerase III subunit gamma/tau [Agromyces bracchium]
MSPDPDEDDALRWEGDDDALAPGWKRVGTPAPLTSATGADTTAGEVVTAHAGASSSAAEEAEEVDERVPAQPGSAELVLLGVFGGVYLLYTLGWILSVLRVQNTAADPLSQVMFAVGTWLAVLAPALWFGITFALTRGRTRLRLVWLLVGAVVLLPIAFVAGVTP